jgi:hypothetical protein
MFMWWKIMKFLKIMTITLIFALTGLVTGLPVLGLAVGFAALYGSAPAMLAGALAGAFASNLPMGLAFLMPALLAFSGMIAGRFALSGRSLFGAFFAIISGQTICELTVFAVQTGELTLKMAARAGLFFALSVALAGLFLPVFKRMAGERYA